MGLSTSEGAYVHWNAHHDAHATLILYKHVHTAYLLVVYTDRRVRSRLCSFADLLDLIPVTALRIASLWLPFGKTLSLTIDLWLCSARVYLEDQLRRDPSPAPHERCDPQARLPRPPCAPTPPSRGRAR